jgi:hypothetical protein
LTRISSALSQSRSVPGISSLYARITTCRSEPLIESANGTSTLDLVAGEDWKFRPVHDGEHVMTNRLLVGTGQEPVHARLEKRQVLP